jgi:hypothetical protein
MRECMLQLTESGIKCKGKDFFKIYQLLHGPFLASNNISCTSENNYTEGAYKRELIHILKQLAKPAHAELTNIGDFSADQAGGLVHLIIVHFQGH